jgi:hypothetical protein
LQDAARVGCCDQRLDHSARNRMRLIAPHPTAIPQNCR